MRVLMITGDRRFGPGHPRYELQKSAVEALEVLYWGRGALWPRLSQGACDVVTVQDPFFRGLFGLYAARNKSARLEVQVHTDLTAQSVIKRALARLVLHRADGIRAVSEKIKGQIEAMGARAPITVLPVFVDLARFRAVQHKPHEGKKILWIGRFEKEKDPLAAVAVFEAVLRQIPDATLTMLGKGSLEAQLKKCAKKLPVEFPGWVDPLPHLEAADAVLNTSKHESWGASIIESLAASVPVVAPDVGVAKEAGAVVVPRGEQASAILKVLLSGKKGELQLQLPDAREWALQWKKGLARSVAAHQGSK